MYCFVPHNKNIVRVRVRSYIFDANIVSGRLEFSNETNDIEN